MIDGGEQKRRSKNRTQPGESRYIRIFAVSKEYSPMKKYISLIAAAVMWSAVSTTLSGQTHEGAAGDATPVQTGRELPRTPTVSYPSEKLSLERSGSPSRNFQPLTEWVRHTDDEGNAIFSTKYKVPFEWVDREYFLHIGGATSSYVVIVNGELAGYNQSGRTPAEFDVTKMSTEGLNRLEIIVYKDPAARVLQSSAEAPEIIGEVYLTAQPRIRIRDYVTNALMDGETTALELGVIVKSHLLNPKTVRVYYSIINPDGTAGPYGHRDADFEMKLEDTVRFFVNIPDPLPWSHEAPNLYTLALKLQHEGRYTEYVSYPLALRTVDTADGELLINGRSVPVNAVEYTFTGDIASAGPELQALKGKGVNTLILREHSQTDAFYSLCDTIGMYVCNTADISAKGPSNDPRWEEAYRDRALSMYHTSQHHPSVVMFSLADDSSNGYNLYESYIALKSVEPRRPVVYLDGGGEWNTDALRAALHDQYPTGLDERVRVINDQTDWKTGGIRITPAADIAESERTSLISASGISKGDYGFFTITNGYDTAPLHDIVVDWEARQGKRSLGKGSFTAAGVIRSGESRTVTVGYGKAKRGTPITVTFTLFRPREAFDAPAPTGRPKKNDRPDMVRITDQTVTVEY